MVILKTEVELATMREAGRVVGHTLAAASAAARPGVTLVSLDELAADTIASLGAKPSFFGYQPRFASSPFPGVLCLSVNDELIHGLPRRRELREGDLLSIDCGASVDGYHGDAAVTIPIGEVNQAGHQLMRTAVAALAAGIAAAVPGNRIGDISHAVEAVCRTAGYGVPAGLTGHGVGTSVHEDPEVPNLGRPGRGPRLQPGMALAIEPMVIESGRDGIRLLPDEWTVASADGSRSAHAEHTIAITADGPVILTVP